MPSGVQYSHVITECLWPHHSARSAETHMPALQLKSVLQDRRWVARNQDVKCGNHSDVSESEYDVVDDQEEMLDVRILPARPMYDDTEYAGRSFSIFTRYVIDIFRFIPFHSNTSLNLVVF